jgi:hypothetical protein
MANTNTKRDQELFDRLRAQGLRKRTAKLIAEGNNRAGRPDEAVRQTLTDLRNVVDEAEDRLSGGPAKRRSAAKKAANTRKQNAQARSTAAKKAARTRAKAH